MEAFDFPGDPGMIIGGVKPRDFTDSGFSRTKRFPCLLDANAKGSYETHTRYHDTSLQLILPILLNLPTI
jgi:hypothetical protein